MEIPEMKTINTIEELEDLYGKPREPSIIKEPDLIIPHYRTLIEASPFVAVATGGPEGLDCSPRGDEPGFVRAHDERTLMLPYRHGNNRIDSFRNIVHDPRVALLFLIPGSGNTLRVNGNARIATEPALLESFVSHGKAPRSVLVVTVESIFFQCARAIIRSDLWNPGKHVEPDTLPTPGQILDALSGGRVDGEKYDREWPERAKRTMW